ncbi:hypothetical protein DEU56DRAFT_920375 [Suillus clintonianus]|uniref:uncharacterized protein n=1 Tax=Suillus clintonianus TaxID=1904413 RepID=UPI001B864E24|nr:uncharacterized protein DEU56DRAFT_920375 [Suillus clintonianus]KAG2109217.1 hypothetical protein DEU56DRAFT_920375 [Suillus clintonianus]
MAALLSLQSSLVNAFDDAVSADHAPSQDNIPTLHQRLLTPQNVPPLSDLINLRVPRFATAFYQGVGSNIAENPEQANRITSGGWHLQSQLFSHDSLIVREAATPDIQQYNSYVANCTTLLRFFGQALVWTTLSHHFSPPPPGYASLSPGPSQPSTAISLPRPRYTLLSAFLLGGTSYEHEVLGVPLPLLLPFLGLISKAPLLPPSGLSPKSSGLLLSQHLHAALPETTQRHLTICAMPLKYTSLITLAVQNATLSIVMHYSRVTTPPHPLHPPPVAVLLCEILKGSMHFTIALRRAQDKSVSGFVHSLFPRVSTRDDKPTTLRGRSNDSVIFLPTPPPALTKHRHALLELLTSERAYASDLALLTDVSMSLATGYPPPFGLSCTKRPVSGSKVSNPGSNAPSSSSQSTKSRSGTLDDGHLEIGESGKKDKKEGGISGLNECEITVTNYSGAVRHYPKKLIQIMGGRFTPSMSQSNKVLVAGCSPSTKTQRAGRRPGTTDMSVRDDREVEIAVNFGDDEGPNLGDAGNIAPGAAMNVDDEYISPSKSVRQQNPKPKTKSSEKLRKLSPQHVTVEEEGTATGIDNGSSRLTKPVPRKRSTIIRESTTSNASDNVVESSAEDEPPSSVESKASGKSSSKLPTTQEKTKHRKARLLPPSPNPNPTPNFICIGCQQRYVMHVSCHVTPPLTSPSSTLRLEQYGHLQRSRSQANAVQTSSPPHPHPPRTHTHIHIPLRDLLTGAPLVLTANGFICVGTDKGQIFVFDFKQTLKCICGSDSSGSTVGPVSAIALSNDHTFVASGHTTGYIQLFNLKTPEVAARTMTPVSLATVASGRQEGHLPGSRIISRSFVAGRHTAAILGSGHAKDGPGARSVGCIGIPKVGVVNASASRMRSLRTPKPLASSSSMKSTYTSSPLSSVFSSNLPHTRLHRSPSNDFELESIVPVHPTAVRRPNYITSSPKTLGDDVLDLITVPLLLACKEFQRGRLPPTKGVIELTDSSHSARRRRVPTLPPDAEVICISDKPSLPLHSPPPIVPESENEPVLDFDLHAPEDSHYEPMERESNFDEELARSELHRQAEELFSLIDQNGYNAAQDPALHMPTDSTPSSSEQATETSLNDIVPVGITSQLNAAVTPHLSSPSKTSTVPPEVLSGTCATATAITRPSITWSYTTPSTNSLFARALAFSEPTASASPVAPAAASYR